MKNNEIDFRILDVGCGDKPRGNVNIDFFKEGFNPQTGDQVLGNYVEPKKIVNFILADAMYLPIKDAAFEVTFSSHLIEHVNDPFLMLKEMCRVSNKKIVVLCPHRKGSGAKRPHHRNMLDEEWFKKTSNKLSYKNNRQFVTVLDRIITGRLERTLFAKFLEPTILWSIAQKIENARFIRRLRPPFEIMALISKNEKRTI